MRSYNCSGERRWPAPPASRADRCGRHRGPLPLMEMGARPLAILPEVLRRPRPATLSPGAGGEEAGAGTEDRELSGSAPFWRTPIPAGYFPGEHRVPWSRIVKNLITINDRYRGEECKQFVRDSKGGVPAQVHIRLCGVQLFPVSALRAQGRRPGFCSGRACLLHKRHPGDLPRHGDECAGI